MIKLGLIGDGIDPRLLEAYPLQIGQTIWAGEAGSDGGTFAEHTTRAVSILLQSMSSYNDVECFVAKVPLFPPEDAMKALCKALGWMAEEVQPDFVHIGFCSTEGKYQKKLAEWLTRLAAQGCQIICPAGVPPAFPASLDQVVAVADRGFIDAGFGFSKPDIIIEERFTPVFDGQWMLQGVTNEIASAMVLSQMVGERIEPNTTLLENPVQLPPLDQLRQPDVFSGEGEGDQFSMATPTFFEKAKWFIKSLISRLITPTGKVPAYIKQIRKVSCNGGMGITAPCQFRVESKKNKGSFVCGACGCGDKQSVFVSGHVPGFEKLDYPYVSCPASMPGFSNYLSSEEEVRPDRRKQSIEAKFGPEMLARAQKKQGLLSEKLEKRLGWLERL
jgi:hypothetical protein